MITSIDVVILICKDQVIYGIIYSNYLIPDEAKHFYQDLPLHL